jgi:hypothetical protein
MNAAKEPRFGLMCFCWEAVCVPAQCGDKMGLKLPKPVEILMFLR